MVLALGNRMPVMAEEVVSEELKAADTLNLTVSYPSDIKCGEEVTFKLLATGGSGTYKYRIASLTDAQQNFVYDISYGSNSVYGDSDEFKFTFYASGTIISGLVSWIWDRHHTRPRRQGCWSTPS